MKHRKILDQLAEWFKNSNFEKMLPREVSDIIKEWQPEDCNCQRYWDDEYINIWTCPKHGRINQE